MFPIAAAIEMDQTTVIVISGLFTAIGVLLSVIGMIFKNQVTDISTKLDALAANMAAQIAALQADFSTKTMNLSNRCEAQRSELEAKLAALEAKGDARHQTTTTKMFDIITKHQTENLIEVKELRQAISDVNVSVAGFSGNFVTRREYEEGKE